MVVLGNGGVVDRVDHQRNSNRIRPLLPVAGPIGELVGSGEVRGGQVAERAVRLQCQATVRGAVDQFGQPCAADRKGIVCEDSRDRIHGQARILQGGEGVAKGHGCRQFLDMNNCRYFGRHVVLVHDP